MTPHAAHAMRPYLGELRQLFDSMDPAPFRERDLSLRIDGRPVFTNTYGYPGAAIDLIKRGLVPAGYLSGPNARLLLGLVRRGGGGAAKVAGAFAPYQ